MTIYAERSHEICMSEDIGEVSYILVPNVCDVLGVIINFPRISVLGVGVTEAGLASADTQVMHDLYDLLHLFFVFYQDGVWQHNSSQPQKICILDMDNVPNNGSVIQKHMEHWASAESSSDMQTFLKEHVVFLDTMVDRITSQRDGSNGLVPRCEPVPMKALVILDPHNDLPSGFSTIHQETFGVVLRSTREQLDADIALKLRVANGTHTAVAHTMALLKLLKTDALSSSSDNTARLLMTYLDALFHDQILPGASAKFGVEETEAVYKDWRNRLIHPYFGLSTFFITQNGPAKGGIRFGPTVVDLVTQNQPITVSMAFAYAALLRWLTPAYPSSKKDGIYTGWLDGSSRTTITEKREDGAVEYADGLRYNLDQGWYEFKCSCMVEGGKTLSDFLGSNQTPRQPAAYFSVIREYLIAEDGGKLDSIHHTSDFDKLVKSIASLYARTIAGESLLDLLKEMEERQGAYTLGMSTSVAFLSDDCAQLDSGKPLPYKPYHIPDKSPLMKVLLDSETAKSVLISEVQSAEAIDLHTHLLPPSHGALCLWGIDELLTYVSALSCRRLLIEHTRNLVINFAPV